VDRSASGGPWGIVRTCVLGLGQNLYTDFAPSSQTWTLSDLTLFTTVMKQIEQQSVKPAVDNKFGEHATAVADGSIKTKDVYQYSLGTGHH
jgi:hypothetical protein